MRNVMNQEKSSVRKFLFCGTLVVPTWGECWRRYLLLLIIGVATVVLTSFPSPWLHWNKGTWTVTSFGIARCYAIECNPIMFPSGSHTREINPCSPMENFPLSIVPPCFATRDSSTAQSSHPK